MNFMASYHNWVMWFGTTSSKLEIYIEKWRCLLWNKTYILILRDSPSFEKSLILMKNNKDKLGVKHVI